MFVIHTLSTGLHKYTRVVRGQDSGCKEHDRSDADEEVYEQVVRAMRGIRNEKLREHQYKERYARYFEGKGVELD